MGRSAKLASFSQATQVAAYWACYAEAQERELRDRRDWGEPALSRGVLKAAASLVSALAGVAQVERLAVPSTDLEVWGTLAGQLGQCRMSIITLPFIDDVSKAPIQAYLEEAARETICLCILPRPTLGLSSKLDEFGAGVSSILSLCPADIDALARSEWDLTELIQFKMYRRFVQKRPDSETQYDPTLLGNLRKAQSPSAHPVLPSLENALSELQEDPRKWVVHPAADQVAATLKTGRSCLLTGLSSSGKSFTALQAGYQLRMSGHDVLYLNTSAMRGVPFGVMRQIVMAESTDRSRVVILDDLQSSPNWSRYLLAALTAVSNSLRSGSLSLLAISWPGFAPEAVTLMGDCLPINIASFQVASLLTASYGSGLDQASREKLLSRCGNDLLLLRRSLERGSSSGTIPTLDELASDLWEVRTRNLHSLSNEALRATLVASSLGRLDIAIPQAFLTFEARVSDAHIDKFTNEGLLRRVGSTLTMGHRSLSTLVSDWLSKRGEWKALTSAGGPKNVAALVLDYLRSLDASSTVEAIRALQVKVGFRGDSHVSRRAKALAEVWRTLNALLERVDYQQRLDPTWGHSASSAMFAIQSLMEVGNRESAYASIQFLRSLWKISTDGALEFDLSRLTSQKDFVLIRESMAKDDEESASKLERGFQDANSIDFVRFHTTWLAGVVLCAEAAHNPNPESLAPLLKSIESMQLPSGAFYPERVPWVTARVMIGLAAAGRTAQHSSILAACSRWLLETARKGDSIGGSIWRSGTGAWNSTLETTAMVLDALALSGLDTLPEVAAEARNYLFSLRSTWTLPGGALDGAYAIQAYLLTGGAWEDVASELQQLSRIAEASSFWQGAVTSAETSLRQSCSSAQIAFHLVKIAWQAIRTNLPALLEALDIPDYGASDPVAAVATPRRIVAEPAQVDAQVDAHEVRFQECLQAVRRLPSLSLTRTQVVGDYCRFPDKVRSELKLWVDRLTTPLKAKSFVRENFLIWANPGSGKSYLLQETGRSLEEGASFREVNCAKVSKVELMAIIKELRETKKPMLVLVDEVDAQGPAGWLYEELFPCLDLNTQPELSIVFALVGSTSSGVSGLARQIQSCWKGKDLIDRVPVDHKFEIPPMTLEDRGLIFAKQIVKARQDQRHPLSEIERLALYYVLCEDSLGSPRQLRDLAVSAASRMGSEAEVLRYDDLFHRSDRKNQRFWAAHWAAAEELANEAVAIEK